MKWWSYLILAAILLVIYWLYYQHAQNLASARAAAVLSPSSPEMILANLGESPTEVL